MKNSLYKLLYGLYYTKIPVMVWGNPGIGKTSTIRALSEDLGVHLKTIYGNKVSPTKFQGVCISQDIPVLNEDGIPVKNSVGDIVMSGEKELKIVEPVWVAQLKKNPKGILFCDELTTSSQIIQSAMLSLIQDCEVEDFTIPDTIFRVAAGNYDNVSGCHQISNALNNRFCHIFAESNIENYCNGIVSGWATNKDVPIINSGSELVEKYNKYAIAVADFLHENNMYLNVYPEEILVPQDVAYPTERSWENVINVMKVLDKNEPEYLEEIVCGLVGKSIGQLFMRFLDSHKGVGVSLPDYLGKEETFRLPNPDRHDHVAHIMNSAVYYLYEDPKKYAELWLQVAKVVRNDNGAFGSYVGYPGVVRTSGRDALTTIATKGGIRGNELKRFTTESGLSDTLKLDINMQ